MWLCLFCFAQTLDPHLVIYTTPVAGFATTVLLDASHVLVGSGRFGLIWIESMQQVWNAPIVFPDRQMIHFTHHSSDNPPLTPGVDRPRVIGCPPLSVLLQLSWKWLNMGYLKISQLIQLIIISPFNMWPDIVMNQWIFHVGQSHTRVLAQKWGWLVGWLVNRPKWDRPGHGTGPHVMGMVVCKVTQAAGRPDICPSRSTNGPTTFEHPEAPFEDMCVASKMLFFDKMLFMFPQLWTPIDRSVYGDSLMMVGWPSSICIQIPCFDHVTCFYWQAGFSIGELLLWFPQIQVDIFPVSGRYYS